MAELNFGLLTPPGSQSIGNAFVQGMDQAAVARAQENQNALSQYTLGKARREDELTNKMLAGLQGATTIEEQAAVLRSVGKVREASELMASDLTRRYTQGKIDAQGPARQLTQTQLFNAKLTQSRSMLEGISTPEAYIAWHEANHNDPVLGPELTARGVTVEQSRARITAALQQPGGLERLINESKLGVEEFAKQLSNQNKPPDVARLIAYRDSLPPGPNRDAVTAQIESPINQNRVMNPVTGVFEDRRQGQPPSAASASRAFVDPGIPQGVTPQMQMSNVDEARRQAIAMDAAGLPVNIRVGNALTAAQPQTADVNALRPQPPAATATTALNPRQTQTQFETDENIRRGDSEAMSKLRVKEYEQLGTAATSARKSTQGIATAERILTSGFNTGWGTEAQAAAANILASFGVPEAKNYATNAQLFLAQARTVTNDRLLDQKGPQTDNDFRRVEETGARLGNTADANKFLLAVNRAINNQTIEKHSFFTKWETKNNSLKGAEQAWQDSPAGNASLFDRPELKQYAQQKSAPSAIPQAAIDDLNAGRGTPAQFDATFGAGAAARAQGKK